jgi:hypothetical protein
MTIKRSIVEQPWFNPAPSLPFNLRIQDVALAMQDVYDFFFDVNSFLLDRGLPRLDDTIRSAIMSGLVSDMLTESVAKHSRSLTPNRYHNGHPDLLVAGVYPEDSAKAGTEGIEIKTTGKRGGGVDFHGARDQWVMVFVYVIDTLTEPASDRAPLRFSEVYLAKVTADDFRRNERGELGTRTATLDREGLIKLRAGWLYREP